MADFKSTETVVDSQTAAAAVHNLAVFDVSLLTETGLPPAKIHQLLGLFLQDMKQQVGEIESALRAGETDTVGKIAHSLKSSSRQIGALRLGEAAWYVEQAARSEPVSPHLPELVNALTQLTPPTLDSLNQYLHRGDSL